MTGHAILVVEEEDAVRQFIVLALQRLGYEVLEARTSAEARARFELTTRVSLLLTEVVLSDGTGPALYRLLGARNPRLRLLLISAYPNTEVIGQLEDGPVGDILIKPFTVNALWAKVREALAPLTG